MNYQEERAAIVAVCVFVNTVRKNEIDIILKNLSSSYVTTGGGAGGDPTAKKAVKLLEQERKAAAVTKALLEMDAEMSIKRILLENIARRGSLNNQRYKRRAMFYKKAAFLEAVSKNLNFDKTLAFEENAIMKC